MPNIIKWISGGFDDTSPEGINFQSYRIGNHSIGYGPSDDTDYWNGIEHDIDITVSSPTGPEYVIHTNYLVYNHKKFSDWNIWAFETQENLIDFMNHRFNLNATNLYNIIYWMVVTNSIYGNVFISNRNYDDVVTDSLVLYVDSFHINSYAEMDASWFNLIGYDIPGFMYNVTWESGTRDMTFDSSSSVYFDAMTNVLAGCTCPNGITVEVWLKLDEGEAGGFVSYANEWYINIGEVLNFYSASNDTNYSTEVPLSYFQDGNFHQIAFTCGNFDYFSIYVDGAGISQTEYAAYLELTNDSVYIGWDSGGSFQGRIGIYRIYNKILSKKEITNNYNNTIQKRWN